LYHENAGPTEHGKSVGAKNIDDYYAMAKNALDSTIGKRGVRVPWETDYVFRHTIDGKKYIDVAHDIFNPLAPPTIVSFGLK
jgi:hypothetical protein